MRDNGGLRKFKFFPVYDEDDVKRSQRLVHLGIWEKRKELKSRYFERFVRYNTLTLLLSCAKMEEN
jgi:hypothetical protein